MLISQALKRALDILVALAGLMAAAPLMAALAIAIRSSSPGPALFRQTRVGRHGRPFTIYKFRSMYMHRANQMVLSGDEDGITPLGHLMRRTSLDELPQLFNILNGSMSLVGPRPTLPELAAEYDAEQRKRLKVKPGLTGWAQVNGRNAIPWDRRIELDVWYAENWSIGLDLRILMRTARVVLAREGVYNGPEPS